MITIENIFSSEERTDLAELQLQTAKRYTLDVDVDPKHPESAVCYEFSAVFLSKERLGKGAMYRFLTRGNDKGLTVVKIIGGVIHDTETVIVLPDSQVMYEEGPASSISSSPIAQKLNRMLEAVKL